VYGSADERNARRSCGRRASAVAEWSGDSEVEIVGDARGDLLEGGTGAADALEAYAVERKARQFAHLHLPLHRLGGGGGGGRLVVRAEQQVAPALLDAAAVQLQHARYLPDHLLRTVEQLLVQYSTLHTALRNHML
jgi:hypothetical protein